MAKAVLQPPSEAKLVLLKYLYASLHTMAHRRTSSNYARLALFIPTKVLRLVVVVIYVRAKEQRSGRPAIAKEGGALRTRTTIILKVSSRSDLVYGTPSII
jgi:hypothetical protein